VGALNIERNMRATGTNPASIIATLWDTGKTDKRTSGAESPSASKKPIDGCKRSK